MISERTIKNWRKSALREEWTIKNAHPQPASVTLPLGFYKEIFSRLLRLTQELADIQLMKEKK